MDATNWGFLTTDRVEHVSMHTTASGSLVVTNWETHNCAYVGDYTYRAHLPLWSEEQPNDMPQESI